MYIMGGIYYMIDKDYKLEYISNHYSIIPLAVCFNIRWFIISIDNRICEGFSDSYSTKEEAIDAIMNYLDNICLWNHLDGYKQNLVFPVHHKIKDGIAKYSRKEKCLSDRPYCEFCGKRIIIE